MTIETFDSIEDAAIRAHQVAADVARMSPEMTDMNIGENGTRCLRFRRGDAVTAINIMMQSPGGYWVATDAARIVLSARHGLIGLQPAGSA